MNRTGYKRKFPAKKYPTQAKSMVLPYGKNIKYRKPSKRTKKAIQQINSIQYNSANRNADIVPVAGNTPLLQISAIKQGTGVDNCVGTQVYAKSLYVQMQVSISPRINPGNDAAIVAYVENGGIVGTVYAAKAKNVRVAVILDRSPNGTLPTLADVYKQTIVPNIKGYYGNGPEGQASSLLMLDPNKTRRFKVLMNEIITVSFDTPCVHFEKYIPLNFFIQMNGNNGGAGGGDPPSYEWLVTNGIYIVAFTEPETCTNPTWHNPFWAFTSKLRFEP